MNHAAACALWLALAGLCPALEPPHRPLPAAPAVRMAPAPAAPGLTVEGQYVLTVTALPFTVTAPQDADLYFWSVPPGWKASGGERSVQVTAAPEGSATVTLQTITIDWKSQKTVKASYSLNVAVGKVTPPVPPGPVPPGPDPPPGPAPINIDGLSVLILYESKTKSSLPRGQLAAIDGETVRNYLQSHCAADPDRTDWKAFRIWDKDTDLKGVGKAWTDAVAKGKDKTMPWLIVSNPKKGGGFEGPVPADEAKTLEILKKYGGD